MYQDNNNSSFTNKFIFSDSFYENLEKGITNDSEEMIDKINDPFKIDIPIINEKDDVNNGNFDIDTNNVPNDDVFNINKVSNEIINSNTITNEMEYLDENINNNENDSSFIEELKEDNNTLDNNTFNQENYNLSSEISVNNLEDNNYKTNLEHNNHIIANVDDFYAKKDVTNLSNSFLINEKIQAQPYRAIRRQNNNINYLDDDRNDENKIEIIDTYNYEDNNNKVEEFKPSVNIEPIIIKEEVNYHEEPVNVEIKKSTLIDKLLEKEKETGKISMLARYGDDFCSHDYITNPAIGRENEIKELGLILITPDKSAILVGKPGIGKTSIVEGFAYRIQRGMVPEVLKDYSVVSVKTTSLLGTLPNGETRLQTLIDELKELDKIILFIDEVHMLMGATNERGLDFANMFKESLGRGSIKMIGATTTEEYERYVLRDKAFVRRFQKVDVFEPTKEQTVEILMGTLPKLEKNSNAKLKYTHYLQVEIMNFIVDITSEYKRIYGIGSRYPDICITLLTQAFSEAIFNNRKEVNIIDIRNAIKNSKNIYPDVIRKELLNFDEKFKKLIDEETTL